MQNKKLSTDSVLGLMLALAIPLGVGCLWIVGALMVLGINAAILCGVIWLAITVLRMMGVGI